MSSRDSGSLLADGIAVFTLAMATGGISISMAVLIFSGDLAPGLSRAVGAFAVAGGVMAIWIAARSRIVPVGTIVQDGPAIVVAAVAADLVAGGGSTDPADVFVLMATTTVITGASMWLLGRFRLGGLVRYMPTTVVAAFIAGTGWLLFKGGFEVMVGFELGLDNVLDLFEADVAKFWLPGFGVGLVAFLAGKSTRLPIYAVGLVILASIGVFYLVAATVSSVASIENGGWLIGPFPDSSGITFISPTEVGEANWSGIAASTPGIASVVGLAAVALLLNLSGIGSQIAPRLDVDNELRVAGGANLLVAVLGASPGFHALGDTLLLSRIGATRRSVPVVTGAILVCLGLLGVRIIGYIPRLITGALLVMVGVSLLESWLRGLRRTVNKTEQVLSAGILVVIAAFGILEGIGAGLVAACVLFVVRYSRIDPVRAVATVRQLRSRVDRPTVENQALDTVGERVAVFQLQGYLFFGSLTSLEGRVRDRLVDAAGETALDAVLLDFKNVTGIDSSGYAVIARLLQEIADLDASPVASSLGAPFSAALLLASDGPMEQVVFAATIDEALEHCEELILNRTSQPAPIAAPAFSEALLAEFRAAGYPAGTVVMEQGSRSDWLMIIQAGHLTASHVLEDGTRQRLRRFSAPTVIGEIGVITGANRTAEIVAETEVVARWLTAARYEELRRTKPELIFELHEFIMKVQSERVVSLGAGLARPLQ